MEPFIFTFLFIGAVQGVILAVVLLTIRRGNRTANRILAAILMLFSINMILHTLGHTRFLFPIPHHSGIVVIFFLPFGPLIYFYVNSITGSLFRFGKKELSHFLPFGICAVLFLPFYLQSLQAKKSHPFQKVIAWLVIIHVLIYIFAVIKRLRDHSRNIKASFSTLEKINLNWLRFFITAVVVIWLTALFLEGYGKKLEAWNLIWILVSIIMYMIGYMGLRQPEIFSGASKQDLIDDRLSKKKYEKSTLTPEKAEEYLQKILQVMEVDKLFLDHSLSLPRLAEKLSISTHDLSQTINERLKQNFFEFVNSHRVGEAKKILSDPEFENLTIAAIGFDTGFNSTSAFNAAFKKHAGMTPSQYRTNTRKSKPGLI